MPSIIYVYCALITFSAFYGCHYLAAKPTYMAGAGLFVAFAWSICIDYYSDTVIFSSIIGLIIYFICAGFWHVIESRSMIGAFIKNNGVDLKDKVEEAETDGGLTVQINLLHLTYGIGAVFYAPIMYMGLFLMMGF